MNDILTIELLGLGMIIFSVALALFLLGIFAQISRRSFKIAEMVHDLDYKIENKITNMNELVQDELKSNNSTNKLNVEKITESLREALNKPVSGAHTGLDELKHAFSEQNDKVRASLAEELGGHAAELNEQLGMLRDSLFGEISVFHQRLAEQAHEHAQNEQKKFTEGLESFSARVAENIASVGGLIETSASMISEKVASLAGNAVERVVQKAVDERLEENFSQMLDKLSGFAAKISEIESARGSMMELSKNMGILAQAFDDRRARGAIGEIVVESLVSESLAPSDYEMKATLSNGERVDCLLKLPGPIGNVAISTKFGLSDMEVIASVRATPEETEAARKSFAARLSAAVERTSDRCVIPGETADAAVLLLPSESAFIEAHTHHRGIIERANSKRVWIASPSTVIAMVNVARSVIKDSSSSREIKRYRSEMNRIEADYERLEQKLSAFTRNFDNLMDTSAKIRKSARTIGERFEQVGGMMAQSSERVGDTAGGGEAKRAQHLDTALAPKSIVADR